MPLLDSQWSDCETESVRNKKQRENLNTEETEAAEITEKIVLLKTV